MIDHLKRSEMFRAQLSQTATSERGTQSCVLFPWMTQPSKPIERENEASYMRDLLTRTIAKLKGPTDG